MTIQRAEQMLVHAICYMAEEESDAWLDGTETWVEAEWILRKAWADLGDIPSCSAALVERERIAEYRSNR